MSPLLKNLSSKLQLAITEERIMTISKKGKLEAQQMWSAVKEKLLVEKISETEATTRPVADLLQELQVYQIELDMQNETLRHAQNDLEVSRERYLNLYEFAPVGYLTLTSHGMISAINLTGATLLGVDRKTLLNKRFRSFVMDADHDRWIQHFLRVKRRDEQDKLELALHRSDGTIFHAQINLVYKEIVAGNLDILLTLTDITERKMTELALYESEARFRFIIDLSPGMVWMANAAKQFIWVNKTWCDFFGKNKEQLLGRAWMENVHPDDFEACLTTFNRHFEGCKPFVHEFRIKRHDGEYRWVLNTVNPRFEDNGKFFGYVGTYFDITELRESKTLLQKVINSSPDMIYVMDKEHRFMLVNESFAKVFNWSPDEMIGNLDSDVLRFGKSVDSRAISMINLHDDDDTVFSGQSIHNPCEKIIFEGGTRYFDTFKTPLRDSTHGIYGNLCYLRDITERLNKEQEQVDLERRLWQAQKMELIGQLTGGIAHDFNNILASMVGFTELLQMSPQINKNPQHSGYLTEILQAGIRAKELVVQLLSFSHKREVNAEAIIVEPIVNEVIKLLRATTPTTISFKSHIARNLPPVMISPVQLHQIVMNLCINSRDAIVGHGTVEIRIEQVSLSNSKICDSCHQSFSGQYLTISVIDSGSGISPENLLNIFDPFFTTKEVGQGSGLGLSVLHGIIHSNNGHVGVDSKLGVGSGFCIYLPSQSLKTPTSILDIRQEKEEVHVLGNVMVVDDEASIVIFMTVLLENLGCQITGLTSATEALHLFENNPYAFDIIFIDQSMPDLTGTDLARAMLSRRSDINIVMSTGYSNSINEIMAKEIGIRHFLAKPVPARVITDIVTACLVNKAIGN